MFVDSEDVGTRDYVLRPEHLPAIIAVLHEVEQTDFLQVFTAAEGAILNADLQVAIRVAAAAVGLPELHGLQVFAVGKGTAPDGNVLVVIV